MSSQSSHIVSCVGTVFGKHRFLQHLPVCNVTSSYGNTQTHGHVLVRAHTNEETGIRQMLGCNFMFVVKKWAQYSVTQRCCGCAWRPPTALLFCMMGLFFTHHAHPSLSSSASSNSWDLIDTYWLSISDLHLISKEVKSQAALSSLIECGNPPTRGCLYFRHLSCARSCVPYARNIHMYIHETTHRHVHPAAVGHLFLSLWPMSSWEEKPELVSSYKTTSATFDSHLSPPPPCSPSQTHIAN